MNFFLLSFFIYFSFGLEVERYESKEEANVNYDDGITYESLVEDIKKAGTNSLEESLALLPTDFLRHYVLMYRSRSLQDASPLYPRAIVFGRSARFILAFNGHEKQKGYNNLEIIQFRDQEQRWEFREITFFKDKSPSFSEANPKKCLECHQSPRRENVDPRPNWEPYNFWPGAYASVDGVLKPVLKPDYEAYISGDKPLSSTLRSFLPQDQILIEEQSLEQKNLQKFFSEIKPQHSRYKFLAEFSVRKPLSLTKMTVILNMRRVARLIKEELGSLFQDYKYVVLGLGDYVSPLSSKQLQFACGDLYLPKSVYADYVSRGLRLRSHPEKKYIRPQNTYRWSFGLAAGFDILFLPLGIQTDDWSMDFRTEGRFAAEDRFTSPHDSRAHFRDAMEIVYQGDSALKMNCKELQLASEQSVDDLKNRGELDRALDSHLQLKLQSARPLVQRCIGCHVQYEDGGQAPSIPFDNLDQLEPLLRQNKYKRGTLFDEILFRTSDHAPLREQMPPAGFTDRQQRDEFIERLRKLLH